MVVVGAGSASTVRVGEMVVGRLVLEPGWRWSEHVRPTAGTTSCQFHHVGLALSGAMDGRMDDGGIHHLKGIPASRHVFQVVAAHEGAAGVP